MSAAAAPKVKKAPAAHPKYSEMVVAAIQTLKERGGSSRQAIVKYIQANYKVGDNVGSQVKIALRKMTEKKLLNQTKGTGASGSFKVGTLPKPKKVVKKKPAKKPAAKKPKAKKPAAKKPAAKKATKSPKKAAKKSAAKKPAAKKSVKSPKKVAKKPAKKVTKNPAAKAKKPAKK